MLKSKQTRQDLQFWAAQATSNRHLPNSIWLQSQLVIKRLSFSLKVVKAFPRLQIEELLLSMDRGATAKLR